MTNTLPPPVREAVDRLLEVAGRDTGQSRKCRDFLLSWWNAEAFGGWNPIDLWGLDLGLRQDILRVLVYLATPGACYPDSLGYKMAFDGLVRDWRPHLVGSPQQQP